MTAQRLAGSNRSQAPSPAVETSRVETDPRIDDGRDERRNDGVGAPLLPLTIWTMPPVAVPIRKGCRVVIESTTKRDKEERTNDDDAEASNNSAFATKDLVAKIGNLIGENAILLSKCREFEQDDRRASKSASLESLMMQKLTRDYELIQGKKDKASAAVESLGAENRKLRATVAEQGRKANW